MSLFFTENLDYVLFVEGMGFLLFGGVSFALHKMQKYSLPWFWIGLFGTFYGLSQWLGIVSLFSGSASFLRILNLALLAISLFSLLQFGLQGLKSLSKAFPYRWLTAALLVAGCSGIWYGLTGLEISCRYAFGLVGGFYSAYTVVLIRRADPQIAADKWLGGFGIFMLVFALSAGLIVPKAAFFPASYLYFGFFEAAFGFSLQFLLGIVAWTILVCVWFIHQNGPWREKRIYVIVFTISTFVILAGGWWAVKKTGYIRLSDETEQVLAAARLSSASIDAELVIKLSGSANDLSTPNYHLLKERLIEMRNAYPEFRFIYLMYQKGDSILFFADSEPATSGDYSAPGDVYSGAPPELTNVFSGHWQQLTVAFTDEWGDWLSAFVPIKDKTNGKIVAVLGIDRSLALIKQAVSFDRLKIIFIITLLMILLVFFYVYNEIQQKAFKRMLESKNKLRTSEEKLSTLISHLHAGVVVHDRDTRIILSNEQASVLLGFPADQLQGKTANDPDFKFISDDGAPLPLDQYPVNMVIADHMPVRNYVMGVVHRPDKTRVWLLVNAFPEFDNQRLARIVITLSDITELKQAEEALIDSENLNRLVIENQGEGIGIVDRNEIFTFANPAADQMFGLPVGGLVGKNLLDFIVPGYFQVIRDETQKRAQSLRSSYELEIITQTGEQKSILVTATPKYDNKGVQSGTFGVFRDITDRKMAENALRESEERYKAAFRTIPEAITITDENGTFVDVNEGFISLSGFLKEEVVGATTISLNIWTNPDDRTKIIETVSKQGLIENLETVFRSKNGTLLTTLVSACLINISNKPHILSITRDITGRKQIENDLIKAKENAEESDRLKSAFLANMSHEIRTPMNIILGFLSHLEEDNLPPAERKNFISIINRKGKDLITIINDIIDISMIDSHQLTISKTTVNLNALLDTMLLAFENEKVILEKSNIKISLEKAMNNENSNIITDEVRLSQILNNLIGNALKFTADGYIKFGYRVEKENLLFFVEDTGKGIAKEKHAIIWERFRQEEESNSRTFGGVGLGLSISRELAGLLGGKLWFTSHEKSQAEGETSGSIFYFTLPVSVLINKPIPAEVAVAVDLNYDFTNKTILIAEDVADNFDVLQIILRKSNPSLIYAENGLKAVELCKTNQDINLILMDIQMPVMDGLTATVEIKKFRPGLPIIALTAHAFLADKAQSIAAGCNNFITKPVDRQKLLKMIDHYLRME
jgi:PAS domain S-box-containing protein